MVEAAQQDPEAFAALYDHYYEPILRFTTRRTMDHQIAYDITANTFYKALKSIHKYTWRGVPFSAWLYRIASNEIKKHFRSWNLLKGVSLDKVVDYITSEEEADLELKEADALLQKNVDIQKLHIALKKLKENHHQILILRFWEQKKLKEIGDIMGKSEQNIKVIIHRSLKKLKTYL